MTILGIAIIAIVALVIGLGIGILVARPLDRWVARHDEEPDDR
jgi:uncharacterized membrane-anchored protein YhcB (DUF1043 family)